MFISSAARLGLCAMFSLCHPRRNALVDLLLREKALRVVRYYETRHECGGQRSCVVGQEVLTPTRSFTTVASPSNATANLTLASRSLSMRSMSHLPTHARAIQGIAWGP